MSEAPPNSHLLLLGQIDGRLQGVESSQAETNMLLRSMDARLRQQEQAAVKASVITSSAVGVGMALLIEGLKNWMQRGGPNA